MNFDCMESLGNGEAKTQYGILYGNGNLVFIKTGSGGVLPGYEQKYLKMSDRIRKKIGATVICASNPDGDEGVWDEILLNHVITDLKTDKLCLSFIGMSDGVDKVLSLAARFPETVKVLGINPSYISIDDLKRKLSALPSVEKILVFGTEDDDYEEIVPSLQEMRLERLEIKDVDGADHQFRGMLDEWIGLADLV